MWAVRERRAKVSSSDNRSRILYFAKRVCFWALSLSLSTLRETENGSHCNKDSLFPELDIVRGYRRNHA